MRKIMKKLDRYSKCNLRKVMLRAYKKLEIETSKTDYLQLCPSNIINHKGALVLFHLINRKYVFSRNIT